MIWDRLSILLWTYIKLAETVTVFFTTCSVSRDATFQPWIRMLTVPSWWVPCVTFHPGMRRNTAITCSVPRAICLIYERVVSERKRRFK